MTDLSELTIADVRAVEIRDVPFSEGLVPPWNPTQRITSRDYVVVRVETDQGIVGLSLDGDYSPHLPASVREGLHSSAWDQLKRTTDFQSEAHQWRDSYFRHWYSMDM